MSPRKAVKLIPTSLLSRAATDLSDLRISVVPQVLIYAIRHNMDCVVVSDQGSTASQIWGLDEGRFTLNEDRFPVLPTWKVINTLAQRLEPRGLDDDSAALLQSVVDAMWMRSTADIDSHLDSDGYAIVSSACREVGMTRYKDMQLAELSV